MKFFAVTGNPILFSRSPEWFNSLFEAKKMDAKYLRLSAQSAEEAIKLFKELDLSGMNVTAPFKSEIIKYLDKVEDIATKIGAVNTICKENGKLVGYNTDYNGIINTIEEFSHKKILLLGAGGAARAVAYTVSQKGGTLCIFNRTSTKAKTLAQEFNSDFCTENELQEIAKTSDIIINTIPNGIKVLEDHIFCNQQIIFDAIYQKPVYQEVANKYNLKFYSGETWLFHQAQATFKLFFKNHNILPDEYPKSFDTKAKEKIIFVGFMGSGKSSIAEAVSQKLDCRFFCTDSIIKNKEGLSINEMFEKYGESYFRKTEQDVLTMLSSMSGKAIISSGGGMVLNEKNRDLIAENYLSIWLYANPKTIMERTKPENRPLLKDNFNLEFIEKLMNQRKEIYANASDIIINTNHKTIENVVQSVLLELASI